MGSKRERHKQKLVDKQRPIQMELINTSFSDGIMLDQTYRKVDPAYPVAKRRNPIAAGIWQHSQTQFWQVWYSVVEGRITWVSAHRDPEEAIQKVEEIKLAYAQNRFFSPEFFLHMVQTMTAPPENMSETEVAQVLASIPPETEERSTNRVRKSPSDG